MSIPWLMAIMGSLLIIAGLVSTIAQTVIRRRQTMERTLDLIDKLGEFHFVIRTTYPGIAMIGVGSLLMIIAGFLAR